MQDFSGRVGVVTGAASGIGLAVATRLASEGMRVVLADVEEEALAKAEESLASAGRVATSFRCDVSKWDEVEALAAYSKEHFGAVNFVHNNAGVVIAGGVGELTLPDWEWVLGVDLFGVIYGVRAFLPLIEEAGEGYIVNTASTAGFYSQPFIGAYNVAKFGVVALSETLHRELQLKGSPVGVSVLCPGAIDTRISESDRNRPGHVETTRAAASFKKNAGEMLAKEGLPAADVADLVVEAVLARRFWILTHPAWLPVLRERVAAMEEGRLTEGSGG